jgi:membrane protease YdiL (CAAX protease family)
MVWKQELWPQLAIVGAVGLISSIYLNVQARRLRMYMGDVSVKKKFRHFLLYVLPAALLWSPTVEELFVRLPLIVFFDTWSLGAVIGLIASTVLFTAWHIPSWFAPGFYVPQKETRLEYNIDPYSKWGRRSLAVITTYGAILGAVAIEWQSLYVCVLLHMVMNIPGLTLGLMRSYRISSVA